MYIYTYIYICIYIYILSTLWESTLEALPGSRVDEHKRSIPQSS